MFTFGDIFNMAIKESREDFFAKLDPELDYTFELVSPYNKVVTPYSESALYIIGVRDKTNNFKEINIREVYDSLPEYIKHPELFSIKDSNGNFIGFEALKELHPEVNEINYIEDTLCLAGIFKDGTILKEEIIGLIRRNYPEIDVYFN